MSLEADERYIVCIAGQDAGSDTFNEYRNEIDAKSCIHEAIEEDSVNPVDVTVYKGKEIKVDITISDVAVEFHE